MNSTSDRVSFFNSHSASWDGLYSPEELELARVLVERCHFGTDETLLEAGSGTGVITAILAQVITGGVIKSIDNSPEMIRKAGEKNFPGRVETIVAPVQDVPFPDGFFTSILCFNSFPHFHPWPAAIKELKRTLSPGGRLFIVHSLSRESLNRMHREIGGPVEQDALPAPALLEAMFKDEGLWAAEIEDGPGFFFMKFIKPAGDDEG